MARKATGATVVRFYQLDRGSVERTWASLLERIHANNLRACLVASNPEQAARLDDYLWTFSPDSFLPHGSCNGPEAADHPLIICMEPKDGNGATVLVLVHGGFVETFAQFDMVLDFVTDLTPEGLQASRERYRKYRELGCCMEYWVRTRDSGWQLKSKEPGVSR